MISTSSVNSLSTNFTSSFTKFNSCINEATSDNVWKGVSKDNAKKKSDIFLNNYKNVIQNQFNNLYNASEQYNSYERCKKEIERLSAELNTISDDNADRISYLNQQIYIQNSKMKELKKKIDDALNSIISAKIENEEREFTNYYQTDYPNVPYGDNVARSGCGVTSMAMIMDYYKSEELSGDPVIEMAQWSIDHGYCTAGTDSGFFPAVAQAYGLECKKTSSSWDKAYEALMNDQLIVINVPGHYMVLSGIDDNGNIIVADPANIERYKGTYDEQRYNQILNGYNMWIFDE